MLKKIVFRFLVVSGIVTLSVFLLVTVSAWLATRQPAFFAAVKQQPFTKLEAQQFKTQCEALERTLVLLSDSASLKDPNRATYVTTIRQACARNLELLTHSGLVDDAGNIVLSQDRLNSMLVDSTGSKRNPRNVRVQILEDCLRIGVQIDADGLGQIYLSADVRPSLTDDQDLKLEILSGSVGQLPIPIGLLIQHLPADWRRKPADVVLITDSDCPAIILKTAKSARNLTQLLGQIRCHEQQITLELIAPISDELQATLSVH